jgi:putative ABC transport system substrate-binding protein
MLNLRRRELITVVGGAVAWPLAARAQPMPVIGFLSAYPQDSSAQHILAAFHRGLKELGGPSC